MKLARLVLSLVLCATGSVLFAQSPKPKAPEPPKAAEAKPVPQLTDEEKLKLENIELKFSLLQNQQTQLQAQYQELVQSMNAEHPGFTYNVQTRNFIAVPKPPAAEKK